MQVSAEQSNVVITIEATSSELVVLASALDAAVDADIEHDFLTRAELDVLVKLSLELSGLLGDDA